MKKTSLFFGLLILIIFLSFNLAQAEEISSEYSQFRGNPPFIISDFEITKQEGGVIEGKYNLVNEFSRSFADIEVIYNLERYASETKKYETKESGATVEVTTDTESQVIVSQSEPPIFIAPSQIIDKTFQLKYPLDLEPFGNYRLKISFNSLSDAFLPLRQYQFPVIFSGDSQFSQIQSGCYLVDRDNDKYYPADPKAPAFYFFPPLAKIGVQCLFSNLKDSAPTLTLIPKIEIKNRNFSGETSVVSAKETILAPAGFSTDLPSFSKYGSYEGRIDFFDKETNLMFVSPANFYFRISADSQKITGAKINLLKTDKDFYKKGETAKVRFDYYVWENDKVLLPGVNLALKMENGKGKFCGESQKDAVPQLIKEGGEEYYVYPTEEIDLAVNRKCVNPKLIASIFDKNGQELASLVSLIKTQGKTNFASYFIIFLIGLAVVLLSSFFAKRKKAAYFLLLFPIIGFSFFFFGANPAFADHHCSKPQSFYPIGSPVITIDANNNITYVDSKFVYVYTSGGQGHAGNCGDGSEPGGRNQTEYINPHFKRMDNGSSLFYSVFTPLGEGKIPKADQLNLTVTNTKIIGVAFNMQNFSPPINGAGDHGVYVNTGMLYSGSPSYKMDGTRNDGNNNHGQNSSSQSTCQGYPCGSVHHDWQEQRALETTLSFSAYWLDVNKAGTGNGAITGPNINCPGDCNQLFGKNTSVTIYANVTSGVFGGWSGDAAGCGMSTTCTITMNGYKSVTATFLPQTFVCPSNLTQNCSITISGQSCSGTQTCASDGSAWSSCADNPGDNCPAAVAQYYLDLYVWNENNGSGNVTVNYKSGGVNRTLTCYIVMGGALSCNPLLDNNTTITLTANPASGSAFNWGDPPCAGGGAICSWTVTGWKAMGINFIGGGCANGATQACTTGQSCAGTRTCSSGSWGACADNPGDNCPAVAQYYLDLYVWSQNGGSGTVSVSSAGGPSFTCGPPSASTNPCGGNLYNNNSTITLTANPAAGNTFSWVDSPCAGGGNVCSFTITGYKTMAINFIGGCANGATQACTTGQSCAGTRTCSSGSWGSCVDTPGDNCPAAVVNYTLNVTKAGTGSGTVISSPLGINCGEDCSEIYSSGASVTLTATPSAGSVFAGWSGACSGAGACSFTMNSNKSATATFNAAVANYTLNVTKAGTGSGTVISSPAGINCGADCSEIYSSGASVTLTATPSAGSVFAGWSGACSGAGACSFTMNSNKSATATFNAVSRLRIQPTSAALNIGDTRQFTAYYDPDGAGPLSESNVTNSASADWASSDIGKVIVDNVAPNKGRARAVAVTAGAGVIITVSYGGLSAEASVIVGSVAPPDWEEI